MSIQPATISRSSALETARSLIGQPFISSPVQADCFNGWTLIARCLGGRPPVFSPGWGPRDRWMAMSAFFSRGMKLTTLASAQPGDVLVFNMGHDGYHAAILSEVGGTEPKMISCQLGKACCATWVGKYWTDRLVAVFTPVASAAEAQMAEAA